MAPPVTMNRPRRAGFSEEAPMKDRGPPQVAPKKECDPQLEVTMKERGTQLEVRVMKILEKQGYANVRRSVIIRDKNKNVSEIDVVCGRLRKTYVECKNYSHPIDLDKVAKFKEVLLLNRINPKRGLFVTTSTYTPRATTIGIRCLDGGQLDAWERRANLAFRRRKLATSGVGVALVLGALVFGCPDDFLRGMGLPEASYRWRTSLALWGRTQWSLTQKRVRELRAEHEEGWRAGWESSKERVSEWTEGPRERVSEWTEGPRERLREWKESADGVPERARAYWAAAKQRLSAWKAPGGGEESPMTSRLRSSWTSLKEEARRLTRGSGKEPS